MGNAAFKRLLGARLCNNEKRLTQKQQEVEHLKTGIRILNRAIEQQATENDSQSNLDRIHQCV